MQVTQFINTKTGNAVKNHFIILDHEKDTRTFQSYDSTIAVYNGITHLLTIGNNWNYSQTTTKHFYNWIFQMFGLTVKKTDIEHALQYGTLCGQIDVLYNTTL